MIDLSELKTLVKEIRDAADRSDASTVVLIEELGGPDHADDLLREIASAVEDLEEELALETLPPPTLHAATLKDLRTLAAQVDMSRPPSLHFLKNFVELVHELDSPAPPGGRPDIPSYFMNIAKVVATRATCDRKHVGAVLVRDGQILSTGYNGALPGMPHCDEVGHDLITFANGVVSCQRVVHAEVNCLLQAAKHGIKTEGSSLYTTTFPCWACFRALATAGIKLVHYEGEYSTESNDLVLATARRLGIGILRLSP